MWGRDNEEFESGTGDAGRADDVYGDRDGDVRLNPADCDGFSDGELGASTQQIGPVMPDVFYWASGPLTELMMRWRKT